MPERNPGSDPDRIDCYLRVLADRERRAILRQLHAIPTSTATLDDLVEGLITQQGDIREHTHTRLHHTHLPALADTPILDYDTHSGTVRYHGDDALEALLDTIQQIESETDATEP